MKRRCPTCGSSIEENQIQDDIALPTGQKKMVTLGSIAELNRLCYVMLRSPGQIDKKFKGFLEDVPKTLERYGQLTEGQWKFFSVIHKELLGRWPPKPQDLRDPPKEEPALPLDIPF